LKCTPLLVKICKASILIPAILEDQERGGEVAIIDVLVDGRKGGSVIFFTILAPVYCTLYLHQLSFQSVRQERHFPENTKRNHRDYSLKMIQYY
jgi:hypothetical protein